MVSFSRSFVNALTEDKFQILLSMLSHLIWSEKKIFEKNMSDLETRDFIALELLVKQTSLICNVS